MAPARKAISSVERLPTSSCENRSCCMLSVPSHNEPDGGCGVPLLVFATQPAACGATSGPTRATSTKNAVMAAPISTLAGGLRRAARERRGESAGSGSGAEPPGGPTSAGSSVVIGSCLRAGAWVEKDVDEVGEQVRGEHGQRDDQQDALDQRIV